jgi:hypothetical protein
MPDPVTVLTGTFATPATAWGDWVEIPFTTPFAYNGVDNLVIQFAGFGFGPDAPACAMDDNSTARYRSRRVASLDPSAAAGDVVSDDLMDLRFTLQ